MPWGPFACCLCLEGYRLKGVSNLCALCDLLLLSKDPVYGGPLASGGNPSLDVRRAHVQLALTGAYGEGYWEAS